MQSERLSVLVIEQDAAFARHVKMMLEASDTIGKVTIAASVEEAFPKMAQDKFNVIILEFFPQDATGLQKISLLRERAPLLPVIVFGAPDEEAFALQAMHAGAQDYLVKHQLSTRWLMRSIRYTIERHEADMAVLQAEEKYRGIFDHLVEGIFQTTPDGRYLMANTTLARIYGYKDPKELIESVKDIGRRLYVQPGRREEFKRIMDEHDTITRFESEIYRKDGTTIWISENCRAVRDANGKLAFYEGTVEDITMRRTAEDNLRHSEALYHSLVETMPQSIFRKDTRGRYTFVNPEFCKTLGKRPDEILGHTIYDFLPEEIANQREQDDLEVMRTAQSIERVEESKFQGAEHQFIQVIKLPIFDGNGKVIGLQGMFWDITAMKLAEEKIRKAHAEVARSQEELRLKNLVMEEDLKMAREIQLTMLPQLYPVIPRGVAPADSAFHFTHRYLPTGTVGGDFFSVTPLNNTEVAVFICDVAGHGVKSALVTAMVRALVEELRPFAHDPGQFMTKLNSELYTILRHSGTPVLTTAFYFVADSVTGELRYANAGHPKPLHIKRGVGTVEPLANNGTKKSQPALGLFENAPYQTSQTHLVPGDLVMLFTDGLYEVHAADQSIYTQAMLSEATQKRLKESAPVLFDELLVEIRAFSENKSFEDDVCIVGMEFNGSPVTKIG